MINSYTNCKTIPQENIATPSPLQQFTGTMQLDNSNNSDYGTQVSKICVVTYINMKNLVLNSG